MKREVVGFLILVMASSFALTGCQTKPAATPAAARPVVVAPSGQVVVPRPPPPEKHNPLPTPPTPASVWMGGYWAYMDWRWVWIPGHWERLGPPGFRPGLPPGPRPWEYGPRRWTESENKG